MATVRTGEFSSYRSDLIDAHAQMKVWLWDCGSEEPHLPEAPDPPHGKKGDPKFDLAAIKYRRALKDYEAALEAYDVAVIEFKKFQRDKGGPVEFMQWSCDAKDTFKNDAKAVAEGRQKKARYHLSSRTRGYEKLPNGGLPEGMTPGHGQQANLERQIAGEKEFLAALKADPVFGQEVQP